MTCAGHGTERCETGWWDVRVLVVEDEEMLADAMAEGLRQEAFAVDVVHDGEAALERLPVNEYDVMVLDRDLPGPHGDEVCRRAAADAADVRILMLTVSTTVAERVAGLRPGADDHLAKPFAFAEPVARIRALGRRVRPPAPPVLERAGIRLDPHLRETRRDGRAVPDGSPPVWGPRAAAVSACRSYGPRQGPTGVT